MKFAKGIARSAAHLLLPRIDAFQNLRTNRFKSSDLPTMLVPLSF